METAITFGILIALVTWTYKASKRLGSQLGYARPELMRQKFSKLNVLKPSKLDRRKAGQAKPGLGEVYDAVVTPAHHLGPIAGR